MFGKAFTKNTFFIFFGGVSESIEQCGSMRDVTNGIEDPPSSQPGRVGLKCSPVFSAFQVPISPTTPPLPQPALLPPPNCAR